MDLTIDEIKLYQPYVYESEKGLTRNFKIFLDKKKEPLVLEYNNNIESILIHRWATTRSRFKLEEFSLLRYVIRKLFDYKIFHIVEGK